MVADRIARKIFLSCIQTCLADRIVQGFHQRRSVILVKVASGPLDVEQVGPNNPRGSPNSRSRGNHFPSPSR